MKYQPLLWTSWDMSGLGDVPVWLSHHSITSALIGCMGVTTDESGRVEVFIDVSRERWQQLETAFHEFFHCCVWGKKSLKLHYKTEERLAQEVGVSAWRNFKMPRRPHGYTILERYAKAKDDE